MLTNDTNKNLVVMICLKTKKRKNYNVYHKLQETSIQVNISND
jgi:hypothetical protein